MSLGAFCLAITVAVFIVCLPAWRWSEEWGWMPMLIAGAALLTLLFLLLTGRIG